MSLPVAAESTSTKATKLDNDHNLVTTRSAGTRLESGGFEEARHGRGVRRGMRRDIGLTLQELCLCALSVDSEKQLNLVRLQL